MSGVPDNRTFGKQAAPHTIIVARGEKVRHWTIRPWMLASATALATTLMVGCVGSAVLFLSSDRIALALQERNALQTQAYEDRIASLRSQIDRLTSRQTLDRAAVTSQVEQLLGQQEELTARFSKLEPLLDRARSTGLLTDAPERPATDAAAVPSDGSPVSALVHGVSLRPDAPDAEAIDIRRSFDEVRALPLGHLGFESFATRLIPTIDRSMDYVEERQRSQLASLVENAHRKATRIADLLGSEGIDLPQGAEVLAVGGPFQPLPAVGTFEESLDQLDAALTLLDQLNSTTERLPLAKPLTGGTVSSTFGVRTDPFLGRSALHTGIDFVAHSGTPAHATAAGRVVHAEQSGGYGMMVEIEHGDGMTTRYAHLSEIDVTVGDHVDVGAMVGLVGSTGRSTGPHLHYEVRRAGTAIDPARYIRAGEKLQALNG